MCLFYFVYVDWLRNAICSTTCDQIVQWCRWVFSFLFRVTIYILDYFSSSIQYIFLWKNWAIVYYHERFMQRKYGRGLIWKNLFKFSICGAMDTIAIGILNCFIVLYSYMSSRIRKSVWDISSENIYIPYEATKLNILPHCVSF